MARPVIVSIALASTLGLALTACGSSDDGSSTSNNPSSGGQTTASGPVTITYLHRLPDGEGMTKVNDVVAQWNKANPNIKVVATKFDGKAADMVTKLDADSKAGTAPCLAQVGYTEVPSLFTKGLLADVTAQAGEYKTNYSDGAYTLMTVGGKAVGLPQDGGPLVYFYNKTQFAKLGLKVPTTAEEFVTTAKQAKGKGKYIAAFQPDEAQGQLSALAAAAGGTWYSAADNKWKVDANGTASQTVAKFWQTMLDDKSVAVEQRWGDGFKAKLGNQSLIGTIGAAWETPLLAGDMAKTPNEGQWAVAPLPKFGATSMTGPDGGSGIAVMKGCKNPTEAMKFTNWFNTQIPALVSQGLVVAAKGKMTTPDSIKKFYGGSDVFAQLATANTELNPNFPYIPTFPAIGADMSKKADEAGSGKAKVADVFKVAQDQSIKSLKDAGLPVAN